MLDNRTTFTAPAAPSNHPAQAGGSVARSRSLPAAGAAHAAPAPALTPTQLAVAKGLVSDLGRALLVELRDDVDARRMGEELTLDQIAGRARVLGHFGRLVLEAGGGR